MMTKTHLPATRQGVRPLNESHPPQAGQARVPMVRDQGGREPGFGVNVGHQERTASTIAGAVMAGYGLRKAGFAKSNVSLACGISMILTGAALIFRGSTGHCSLYAATGINTAR